MEALLPYLMNGLGGVIVGPILSKLLGGKGATGALAGVIGGLAGGAGMDAAGLQLLGGSQLMNLLGDFLQGGVGGGVIGGVLGLLMKRK